MQTQPKHNHRKSILATKLKSKVKLVTDSTYGLKTTAVTIRFFDTLWKEVKNLAKEKGHSNNSMVNVLVRERLEAMKKPRFTPYAIIDKTRVVLFDRDNDALIVLTLEEDIDERIHILCETHVGAETCEHIEFVKKIPTVKGWLAESQHPK